MKTQRCKGTRDWSPEEMRKFRRIEGIFRDCCLNWGYQEVRTPTLEYLHLFTFTGTLTTSQLSKVYSFLDWDGWSGERVVLRPDGTIPIARLYIDTMEDEKLAKLFYVTNVFTFEATGKESRERWQCGAELVGASLPVADVELVVLALEVLKKLGLENIELRLSHASIIRALLAKFGLSHEEQTRVFDQILDGDMETLIKTNLVKPELGKILSLLLDLRGKSSGFLKNVKALINQGVPDLESPLDNLISIVDTLENLGYDYQIDITSGRGFEYYTGVIFQLFAGGEHVGGGGRYDALIPLMGGKDIPASGFALYLDHLMNLIKPETMVEPVTQKVLVKIESANTQTLKETFALVHTLHQNGHVAELQLGNQETTDYNWLVIAQKGAPRFVLTDRTSKQRFEAQTINEAIKQIKT